MNIKFKKLISIFLVVVLFVGIVPMGESGEFNFSAFKLNVSAATTSQQNIVAWADYYYGITWTAQKTVSGWKGNYTYSKGSSYRLPYGQPVTKGKYIGYGVSVDDFLSATNDVDSVFYTTKSYYSGYSSNSVYYATDCSGFVSLCWGITRKTTASIPNCSTGLGKLSSSTVNKLQIGDCLNSTSDGHVVLVTDVVYSGDTVKTVEITEQTPPQLKRTTYTAGNLVSKYNSKGYSIYRYNGTVPAPPNTGNIWFHDITKPDNSSAGIEPDTTFSISGEYKFWFKESNDDPNYYIDLYIDDKIVADHIGSDSDGYVSYIINTAYLSNGGHEIKAVLTHSKGVETVVKKFIVRNNKCNIIFNANGGTTPTVSKTVTYNGTYGTLPTPTRTGYTFNGWYTATSGGTKITADTKVTITANQTLYAQWKCNHNYTSSITTQPTCLNTGVKTFTCSTCGNKYTETVPTKGHTPVTDKAVSATCTTAGKTEGSHCSVCNAVIKAQTTIPATGHRLGDWVLLINPTYDTEGLRVKKCTICSVVLESEAIPKLEGYLFEENQESTVINYETKTIYGLEEGVYDLEGYVEYEGCVLEYNPTAFGFGTGTKVDIVKDGEVVDTYTIIIFGDINGDGYVDSFDVPDVMAFVNYNSQYESGSVQEMAADINGDGFVDESDLFLIDLASTFAYTVEQSR